MKRPLVRSIAAACVLALLPLPLFAQTSAPSTASEMVKPLGSADRKFIKDAGEQVLTVNRLVEMTKHKGPGSEELKKLNAGIGGDMDKIWGEIGTIAQSRKVELPKTEPSASDKAMIAKIRKTEEDKFDKTLLKTLEKETKKMAQIFEMADKSVQEPALKKVVGDWTPTLKKHAEEVATAEKEAAKKK